MSRIKEVRKQRWWIMAVGIMMVVSILLWNHSLLKIVHAATNEEEEKKEQEVMYGIGSVSKVVVSAAVMKLKDEGKIDIDAPLTNYIEEFEMMDERYKQITPRMLLNHTSGLPGNTLNNAMLLGDSDTYNHDHLLFALKKQRLKADPGAFAVYCNDGFSLAEILVERVTGKSFTDYMIKELAEPLGVSHMTTPQKRLENGKLAGIFDAQTGKSLPMEAANVIGSGGVYATAEDLCRFSQIFMENGRNGEGILSEESKKEMEYSSYEKQVNPDNQASNLSYGLGWDSVNTYPFTQYGIKALVKGGDTSYYHASLTVLPQKNISCAVFASGSDSSSMECQLAVQEIILSYLEEIGEINRKDETSLEEAQNGPADTIPKQLMKLSGWYAGHEMFHLEIKEDGTLLLKNTGTGQDTTQTYQYHEDGKFYSTEGDYISSSGSLLKGNNGRVGSSFLEFKKLENNEEYLMAGIYETYPGLGSTTSYLPIAQKLDTKQTSKSGISEWKKQSGTEFYMVSEKASSTAYLQSFMVKPLILMEPEGYLVFEGTSLKMAKVKDESHAEFFETIPGQAGRDLNDYELSTHDGKTYLSYYGSEYLSSKDIDEFPIEDEEVVIGKDGKAIWFHCGKEQSDRLITIETPKEGAFYVYDHTGKEMTCVSSSWVLGSGRQFLLPEDGRIAFAGPAGASFRIHYSSK